jgi:hypothetical protein
MRLPVVGLILSLNATLGLAQGTVRFEWIGNQNQVQGSFDVTVDELHGYTNWGSPVLFNSISFTDFYGVVMSSDNDLCHVYGTNNWAAGRGWFFDIDLWDFNRAVVLHVQGDQEGTSDHIAETDLGGTILGWGNGNWNYYLVPEPDTTALLTLGLVCFIVRKWRRMGHRKPAVSRGDD